MKFLDQAKVYVRSGDGGATWELYSAGAPQAMLAMHLSAAPGRKLRVATYGLGVWQTDLAPVSSAPEPVATLEVQSIYPNPATNRTQVVFSLEKTEAVTLRVVSIDGKTVNYLPLGILPPGQHKQPLNIADYPAGMYSVILQAGKTRTGKILVKS